MSLHTTPAEKAIICMMKKMAFPTMTSVLLSQTATTSQTDKSCAFFDDMLARRITTREATPLGACISSRPVIHGLLFDTSQTVMLPMLQSSKTYTSPRFQSKWSRGYLEEKEGMLGFGLQSHTSRGRTKEYEGSGQQPTLIGHPPIGGL